jgi:hypothetical protein
VNLAIFSVILDFIGPSVDVESALLQLSLRSAAISGRKPLRGNGLIERRVAHGGHALRLRVGGESVVATHFRSKEQVMRNLILTLATTATLLVGGLMLPDTAEARPRWRGG